MKIVINDCFGGFGLSNKGHFCFAKYKGIPLFGWESRNLRFDMKTARRIDENEKDNNIFGYYYSTNETGKPMFYDRDIDREDPALVKTVEKLGDDASNSLGHLRVIEIPDGTEYEIEEYDGLETVHEKHKSWP